MIRLPLPVATSCLFFGVAPLSAQQLVPDYQVTISYEIFETGDPDTYFQFVGQSAYIQYRTDGSTTGGQMDFASGPDTSSISYTEVFPPPGLSDFLEFAYFGLVETRSSLDDSLIDTSFVFARQPLSVVPGPDLDALTFQDFFPSYTEDEVVSALRDTFDSAIFFDFLGDQIPNRPDTRGIIGIPELGRLGDTLDLVSFVGGTDGSSGSRIGTLGTVVVIPEPAASILISFVGLGLLRRRRESRP